MLKEANFKTVYNSKDNNLIEDFYIPAFKSSCSYDRISAYFDSKILRMYSAGLEHFCSENGKIRFIFSCEIDEEDYKLMERGYALKESYQNKLLDSLNEEDINVDLSNLAYLIAIGTVEIKIAFTCSGVFHDKYGIFKDKSGDTLYFRGSNNETVAAIESNYESFETSLKSNNDIKENEKINNAINNFETIWQNNQKGIICISLPECVREKLISFSPKSLNYVYYNKENSIVFDIDDKNNFIILNNLNRKEILSTSSQLYLAYLKPSVLKTLNDKIYLKKISYIKYNSIIDKWLLFSKRFGFNVYITPTLRHYFYKHDIEIDKRKNLGIAIKHRDKLVINEFNRFKEIVNNNMVRTLREPQMWDAFHIASMIKSANFSVPGSGKTTIVLGAYAYLSYYNLVDKIVMIGPKNSFMTWKIEFGDCFGDKKKLDCLNIQDDYDYSKENLLKYKSNGKNLILVNYESVPNLINELKEIIDDKTFLIFDEVHRIKAHGGVRAKACLSISDAAIYKVVLSGTPIPNSYLDIYNLLHILYSGEYDSFFGFTPNFLKNAKTTSDINKINNSIFPFFCRTTKQDLQIPEAHQDNLEIGCVEMDEIDEKIMQIVYETYEANPLLLYIKLLMASSNPELLLKKVDKQDFIDEVYDSDISELIKIINDDKITLKEEDYKYIQNNLQTRKIDKAIDIIETEVKKNNKVLAWGMFIRDLHLVNDKLRARGIKSVVISGEVSQAERDEIITNYKNGFYDVLITNPHTLAESISLHKICHFAIYFEFDFNLTHMLQSRDRIHRLGITEEERPRYVYMFLKGDEYDTIDEKIYYRLKEKEKRMIDAIEKNDLYIEETEDYKQSIEELLKR